jgi:hypothetical protein
MILVALIANHTPNLTLWNGASLIKMKFCADRHFCPAILRVRCARTKLHFKREYIWNLSLHYVLHIATNLQNSLLLHEMWSTVLKPQSCYTDTKAVVLLPICFEIRTYDFLGDISNLASILYSTLHSTSTLRVLLLSGIESLARNHFMHLKIVFVFGTWSIRKLSSPLTKALVQIVFSIRQCHNCSGFTITFAK